MRIPEYVCQQWHSDGESHLGDGSRSLRTERAPGKQVAFGKPGIEPKWTQGNKDDVGTAYAAGRDIRSFILAMERFATCTGPLTEQVWDEPDQPETHMYLGKPTTAAMPSMWVHAEYIKLLRSVKDGQVFDFVPEVAEHYRNGARRTNLEIWKPNRHVRSVRPGRTLRIQAPAEFRLHWSSDEWRTANDSDAVSVALASHFVDIPISPEQRTPIRFTFLLVKHDRWEGIDYEVAVESN